jgi:hypothetical protein
VEAQVEGSDFDDHEAKPFESEADEMHDVHESSEASFAIDST